MSVNSCPVYSWCSHLRLSPLCLQSQFISLVIATMALLPLAAADGFWGSDWVGLCNSSVDYSSPACGCHLPAPDLFHYFARRWSRCHTCWPHSACHLRQKVRNNSLLGNLMVLNHLAPWGNVSWIENLIRNWHVSTSEMLAIWSTST
jgi:hypothetical protein